MSYISRLMATRRVTSDFWKFWTGQTISTLGSSFTSFALPLLVFNLTDSALNLALTVVITVLPYILFGLIIGAWVDQVQRKNLMVGTDIVRALVIASIPLAAALGLLSIWWIYAVAFINSTLTICFDAANFAAVPSLVSQDDIITANGRIQASYSIAKVMGPLLAGALILVVALPALLLIDAASFLVSAVSLVLVRTSFNAVQEQEPKVKSIRLLIGEGLRLVITHPILRWVTLLLLLINFILPTSSAQLVLFARQWLGASDSQISFLYAGGSLGTAIVALIAGRIRKRLSLGVIIPGSIMLEGLFTALPSLTHWYWATLLFWTLRGGVDVLFIIGTYSLTQILIPNQVLGRVITSIRVLTWSTASLGALLGGFIIVQTRNVALVYAGIGMLIFFIALAFFLTPLRYAERYISEAVSEEKIAST